MRLALLIGVPLLWLGTVLLIVLWVGEAARAGRHIDSLASEHFRRAGHGEARHGEARRGQAWPGEARHTEHFRDR